MIKFLKFGKEDYDRFIGWIDSEESMIQFSGPAFVYPVTHEQLDNYTKVANRLIFKVVESGLDKIIGHAELNNIDEKNCSARICRILIGDKTDRGKGFGKAIINELVRIGFEDLKLHRLDLGVFDFNHQSVQCYKSCGFEIDGHLKDTTKIGNKYWSIYNMSILNIYH